MSLFLLWPESTPGYRTYHCSARGSGLVSLWSVFLFNSSQCSYSLARNLPPSFLTNSCFLPWNHQSSLSLLFPVFAVEESETNSLTATSHLIFLRHLRTFPFFFFLLLLYFGISPSCLNSKKECDMPISFDNVWGEKFEPHWAGTQSQTSNVGCV